jgi:hypothetical protein
VKTNLALVLILLSATSSAFASGVVHKLECESSAGSKQKVSLVTSTTDPAADDDAAYLTIDGLKGEISNKVSSNDAGMGGGFDIPNKNFDNDAWLTADDGSDVSFKIRTDVSSVVFAKRASKRSGSATFNGVLEGDVAVGSEIDSSLSQGETKSASVKDLKVNCKSSWGAARK